MKVFKFRAWHPADKVMVYDLNSLKLSHGILMPDDYIVMQHIWLQDKNGTDLYEGDIFKNTSPIDSEERFHMLKADYTNSCGCCRTISGWDADKFSATYSEIVGNIYENSELIEKCENK